MDIVRCSAGYKGIYFEGKNKPSTPFLHHSMENRRHFSSDRSEKQVFLHANLSYKIKDIFNDLKEMNTSVHVVHPFYRQRGSAAYSKEK